MLFSQSALESLGKTLKLRVWNSPEILAWSPRRLQPQGRCGSPTRFRHSAGGVRGCGLFPWHAAGPARCDFRHAPFQSRPSVLVSCLLEPRAALEYTAPSRAHRPACLPTRLGGGGWTVGRAGQVPPLWALPPPIAFSSLVVTGHPGFPITLPKPMGTRITDWGRGWPKSGGGLFERLVDPEPGPSPGTCSAVRRSVGWDVSGQLDCQEDWPRTHGSCQSCAVDCASHTARLRGSHPCCGNSPILQRERQRPEEGVDH